LLAWVIRDEEARQVAGQRVIYSVAERERSGTLNLAAALEQTQVGAHGDSTQSEDGARAEDFEFAFEIRAAIREFGWQRFVCRRSAAKRSRHVCVSKSEAIVAVRRTRLIGEAGAMQGLVEKIARAIAGEHASGAICSMRRGRKPKNQQLRTGIPKARNGLAPIFPFAKREAFFARDFFAVAHKARARPALDNFLIQLFERVQYSLA
jgi:hypothetical protein